MSNTTTSVRFTIDFTNKAIIGTAASYKKAGKGYGPEYEELAAKIERHPTFELKVKEQKSRSTKEKNTYDGLTLDFMKTYIGIKENSDALMAEYDEVVKKAIEAGSKYPLTKKWFVATFKGFTMEKAKKEIAEYRIASAKTAAKVKIKAKAPTAQGKAA